MDSLHNETVRLEDVMPLMRQALAAGQTVRFSPRGTSMLPLLHQGRDSVALTALPEQIRKHDIILYQRRNGQYVLHRVVGVGAEFTFLGDNQFTREPQITREQLIAKVCSITRNGRNYTMDAPSMWLYSRLWHVSRPVRRVVRRGRGLLGRIFR